MNRSNNSSNTALGRSGYTGASSLLLEDEEVIDSDGTIAAQLHRRDIEVLSLKMEVKRLNNLVQTTTTKAVEDEFKVDPAIELAFRHMAKNLKEKDSEIARLQYHLEATMAALGAGSFTSKPGINKSGMKGLVCDQGELAHRLVTRITVLKDENVLLGVS